MPNAMVTGLAQNQAQQSQQKPLAQGQSPVLWAKNFQGRTGTGINARSRGGNQIYWDAGGPQGPGYYHSPDQNEAVLQSQQYQANQFRENLPTLSGQMGHQLAGDVNQEVTGQVGQVRGMNSHRGLLYGGINAGQEQGVRAAGAVQAAQGRSKINQGLMTAADTMDKNAIKTGFDTQKMQQSIADSVYRQSLADMNSDSEMGQSMAGLIGTGIMLAALA